MSSFLDSTLVLEIGTELSGKHMYFCFETLKKTCLTSQDSYYSPNSTFK